MQRQRERVAAERVDTKDRHRAEIADVRARVDVAQEQFKELKQASLNAWRASITSAKPVVLQVANLLALSSDKASVRLNRGAFRFSERAGTTQQQRCADVASEVIWACWRRCAATRMRTWSVCWDALVSDKKLTDLRPNHFMELQDYKMKLLQVWFREATTRWYGKRGISGHTSMITFAAAV
jgi:hypothetical protein